MQLLGREPVLARGRHQTREPLPVARELRRRGGGGLGEMAHQARHLDPGAPRGVCQHARSLAPVEPQAMHPGVELQVHGEAPVRASRRSFQRLELVEPADSGEGDLVSHARRIFEGELADVSDVE